MQLSSQLLFPQTITHFACTVHKYKQLLSLVSVSTDTIQRCLLSYHCQNLISHDTVTYKLGSAVYTITTKICYQQVLRHQGAINPHRLLICEVLTLYILSIIIACVMLTVCLYSQPRGLGDLPAYVFNPFSTYIPAEGT